jgi:hypothetical protein
MALNVDFMPSANPPALPAAGGDTVVTFQASTDAGASQLQADYTLSPGVPYVLVGPTQLPATAVSVVPQDYSQPLTLQATGGGAPLVQVNILVSEVGTGATFRRSCVVTLQPAPAAASPAAKAPRRHPRQV